MFGTGRCCGSCTTPRTVPKTTAIAALTIPSQKTAANRYLPRIRIVLLGFRGIARDQAARLREKKTAGLAIIRRGASLRGAQVAGRKRYARGGGKRGSSATKKLFGVAACGMRAARASEASDAGAGRT